MQLCSGEEKLELCSLGLYESLFGPQLWINGTFNHFEECSAEFLAGNELKWREVLCLATVVTIVEAPFFGIVCIRRMLQSIGIPKRFQILAKRSASTKDEVEASAFSSST